MTAAAVADTDGTAAPSPVDRLVVSARRGHVQVPAALLRSPLHGGLAVAAWAMYETLMPRALGGGRAAAHARRCWVAAALGVSDKTLDTARRELLTDGPGGPWLARSSPVGAKRAVRHMALRLPRDTDQPYAAVPAWTLDLLSADCGDGRRISPNAWRLYALVILARQGGTDRRLESSMGHLGTLLGASPDTGRRRLRELERADLAEVTQRAGGRLLVRPVLTVAETEETAVTFVTQGASTLQAPRTPRHSPLAGGSSHP